MPPVFGELGGLGAQPLLRLGEPVLESGDLGQGRLFFLGEAGHALLGPGQFPLRGLQFLRDLGQTCACPGQFLVERLQPRRGLPFAAQRRLEGADARAQRLAFGLQFGEPRLQQIGTLAGGTLGFLQRTKPVARLLQRPFQPPAFREGGVALGLEAADAALQAVDGPLGIGQPALELDPRALDALELGHRPALLPLQGLQSGQAIGLFGQTIPQAGDFAALPPFPALGRHELLLHIAKPRAGDLQRPPAAAQLPVASGDRLPEPVAFLRQQFALAGAGGEIPLQPRDLRIRIGQLGGDLFELLARGLEFGRQPVARAGHRGQRAPQRLLHPRLRREPLPQPLAGLLGGQRPTLLTLRFRPGAFEFGAELGDFLPAAGQFLGELLQPRLGLGQLAGSGLEFGLQTIPLGRELGPGRLEGVAFGLECAALAGEGGEALLQRFPVTLQCGQLLLELGHPGLGLLARRRLRCQPVGQGTQGGEFRGRGAGPLQQHRRVRPVLRSPQYRHRFADRVAGGGQLVVDVPDADRGHRQRHQHQQQLAPTVASLPFGKTIFELLEGIFHGRIAYTVIRGS